MFSLFMNAAKMKTLFQRELPECMTGCLKLIDCQIQHPRYKTYLNPDSKHKSFFASSYLLRGVNKKTNTTKETILYVKAYMGDRSGIEYDKACAGLDVNINYQQPLHIEKHGIIAWFFPYDPVLRWLPNLTSLDYMRNYFGTFLLVQGNESTCEVNDIALHIINYRPEIRCTFRYDVELGYGKFQTLYGKTFADEKGVEIHRHLSILYSNGSEDFSHFELPQPIGYDFAHRTLWMRGLQGRALIKSLSEQNAALLVRQLAINLSHFHNVELTGLEVLSEASQLLEIQKKALKLQSAFPSLSTQIATLVADLVLQMKTLPVIPNKLIHGDFHVQQLMLLENNRIALFDFDELAIANPLVDLANFAADIYTLKLGKRLTHLIVRTLFDTYKTLSNFEISDTHFMWHVRIQLLTRAYRAFIQQKPDLYKIVEDYLKVAETGFINN
ncbi:MAG: aminoglycoside phosphotransferase family protein [Methylococcaceae bacterium]|nr:aminoglycoside phosphotransferase family protein [Methylococcaceae bacterium]